MGYYKNKTKRIGGLLLDVLMLVFVLTFSWHDVKVIDRKWQGVLTISTEPLDQISFHDSSFISGSFLKLTSKIQLANNFSGIGGDFPSLEIATNVAFLVTPSLFNTFYRNITINAP